MKKLSLILGMTLIASLAYAQEKAKTPAPAGQTSTVEKSELVPADKKTGDIDDEITNAKLRAETGSKSKYSFRSVFGISGGSFAKPFGDLRPNLLGDPDSIDDTSIDGSIGMKARLSERDNLSVTTGVGINTPFSTRVGEIGQKTNVSGLSLGYDRLYKMGSVQMVSGASFGLTTDQRYINQNNSFGSVGLSQTAIYSTSVGWDVGASANIRYAIYRGEVRDGTRDGGRSAISGGVFPFAEYAFNDTFNFRTLIGFMGASTRNSPTNFNAYTVYQSVGLGISATRDIYFYPNFQFNPGNISSDRTNVAMTMYINL